MFGRDLVKDVKRALVKDVWKRALVEDRDGNGAGFFGYPPCPAPNGTGLKFIKRVWDFFLKPGAGSGIASSRPAPPRLHIKLILNFNLI